MVNNKRPITKNIESIRLVGTEKLMGIETREIKVSRPVRVPVRRRKLIRPKVLRKRRR